MAEQDAFAACRRNERLAFMRASEVSAGRANDASADRASQTSAVTATQRSADIDAPAPQSDFLVRAARSPATAVVAALFLRLGFLWLAHQSANFFSVGQEAGNIAWALARGDGFSSPLVGMQGPTAWVAPVYPVLLALGFKLLSMNPYHVVIFGQVLNSIFSALTCCPIYFIARKLFGSRVALASSWTWALLPTAILFPLEWIWDQSLSAFLLTALIFATLHLSSELPCATARSGRSRLLWAAYGLGWALALLTNPAMGFLLPIFLAWIIWQGHNDGAAWKGPIAIAVLTCVLGIMPWTARNYAPFGQFVPVKSNIGLEFWLGNNPEVKMIWTWWRSPASDTAESAELHRLGEIPYMRE